MNPDEDRRLSRQFIQAVTASDLEEAGQPNVHVSASRPSSPPSFMEDREKSDEQVVRDIADPVCLKARYLTALKDDQDGEAFC